MQYRRLGDSGLKVSTVSLGSWLTVGQTVDQNTSDALVGMAVEQGINLFDTADIYNKGETETALGKSLASLRRADYVLASKCFFPMSAGVNDRGLSRKHIFESVHDSLQRLGTDYLDLYQCHRPDPETPIMETARAMDDLIRQGKILYWGTSLWPASLIREAVTVCRAHGWAQPISNQPRYNLIDRSIEAEVIPVSKSHGVGQIVYSPLAQGVLTGKYRPGEAPPPDSRAATDGVDQFVAAFLSEENLRRAAKLVELSRARDRAPAAVALAWCLRQENVSSVIIGATRPEQVAENCAAAELELDAELCRELELLFP